MSLPAWGVRVEIDNRHDIAWSYESLPAWGVRVEITCSPPRATRRRSSLPAWGVRVEMSGTAPRLSTTPTSLPAWGVRVEIQATGLPSRDRRHSPHGECGLKSAALAWIIATWARHSPHGECGLKSRSFAPIAIRPRHSPHGECGLKFPARRGRAAHVVVTPRMGSAG